MFYYGLEGRSLDGYFQIKEMTAPDTPPLNELRLYVKDKAGASALYLKDDAGSEREIAPAGVVTGAGIANRLAYWTGASTLAANAALVQNRLVTADVNGLPVSHTAVTATHVMFADSNGLPAGDSLFTWNNTDKYLVLPLKFGAAGAQFYTWSTRAGAFLTQQSQSSSTDHRFELYTKDGDGTDSMSLTLFAKGTPAALTNFEQLRLEYDSADTTFKLLTNAGGTGTIRPLRLFTGTNTSQLILNIDGTVTAGSVLNATTGFRVANAAASGNILRGDGTNFVSSSQSGIDHGSIGGLADDDHTQYALLAGRSGGQTLKGDTAASGNLVLESTANATKGSVKIIGDLVPNTTELYKNGTSSLSWTELWCSIQTASGGGNPNQAFMLASEPLVQLTNNENNTDSARWESLKRRAGGDISANDIIGSFTFTGKANGSDFLFSTIRTLAADVGAGTERGSIEMRLANAGTAATATMWSFNGVEFKAGQVNSLIGLTSITAGSPNLDINATSDTPTVAFTGGGNAPTTAPAGYMEIVVAGNPRYIPFWA